LKGRVTERRLAALERRAGRGRIAVVGAGRWDWTKEDLARAAGDAQQRVGPGGMVICVEYVDDWQGTAERTGRLER
jgi:hypothetical protein